MQRYLTLHQFNYRALRGLQISLVFAITIFIQQSLHYPRAGWTGFAVMMIYAGFDDGTIMLRTYHRFLGAILGLLSGYLLWLLGHIDYRTLIISISLTVFFAYFLAGKAYSVPTIFTVNTSVIGTGYFNPGDGFTIQDLIVNYFMCTLIAFAIVVICEYFAFRRFHLLRRFIEDNQEETLTHLIHLIQLLNQPTISRRSWFKGCSAITASLSGLRNLLNNAHFVQRSEEAVGAEFIEFVQSITSIYLQLKVLYLTHHIKCENLSDYNHLREKVNQDIERLKAVISKADINEKLTGVMYVPSC